VERLSRAVELHGAGNLPFRQRQLNQGIQQRDETLVVAHHAVQAEALLECRPRLR
jgi:hypothetical protein